MGCCAKWMRVLLIIFNIIFWLSGAAILGLGVWFLVDKNVSSYFTVVQIDNNDTYFQLSSYFLIGFGAFVFIVGFCGCCGAIRGSKCLLGFYVFFLFLIIIGELAAAVFMILYNSKVTDGIEGFLKKSITEKYANHTNVREAWDFVQIKLECCGYAGPGDYAGNPYLTNKNQNVPFSCCKLSNRDEALNNVDNVKPVNGTVCQNDITNKEYIHTLGCEASLIGKAKEYSLIIACVAAVIPALEIFGIVAAILVCRRVDNGEK